MMKFPRLKWGSAKNIDGNNIAIGPAVYPIIPPNGPWSGSNHLGQQVIFAPDANNRQSILKMDEWGPPEMWTVSLGFTAHQYANDFNAGCEVIAEITFGSGGATQYLECSWVNGTQLSLPMNTISIGARYQQAGLTPFVAGFIAPSDLVLSVQIARGSAKNYAVLADTAMVHGLAGAIEVYTVDRVNIPAFASSVRPSVGLALLSLVNFGSVLNHAEFWSVPYPIAGGLSTGLVQIDQVNNKIPILPGSRAAYFSYATSALPADTDLPITVLWHLLGS